MKITMMMTTMTKYNDNINDDDNDINDDDDDNNDEDNEAINLGEV